MSDEFVESARSQQNVIERLLKGLPGIRGYVDKELRRNADYRVRQQIAEELDRSKGALLDIQNKLLRSGGLTWLDDIDLAVTKVQTLSDRVKTASYGYAGLFDAVRIREDALNALHRFDTALMAEVAKIETSIASLRESMSDKAAVGTLVDGVINSISELTMLFDRRERAIIAPDLLTDNDFTPRVDIPGDVSAPAPESTSENASQGALDSEAIYTEAAQRLPGAGGETPSSGQPA